jgi:hypothetical protein
MQNITNAADLKMAIQSLKVEQEISEELLKAQFRLTYENLKPINIIRNAIKDLTSEPALMDNIVGTTIGLASGYITKKIVVGNSGNIIRKILGSLLEFGVTNVVAKHPEAIKSISQFIFNLFRKKETNSEVS